MAQAAPRSDAKEPATKPAAATANDWLREFVRPLRPIFREVLVMSLFVNLLALAVPVFSNQVYDRVIATAGFSTLEGLMIGMALVVTFDLILRQSRGRIMQKAALRIDAGVGRKLFDKLLNIPLPILESKPNAHWQALFRDAEMVRNTLSGPSALLVADLPFAILVLAVIFLIAKPIVWVLAIILPTFIFLAWRSADKLATLSAAEKQVGMGRDAILAETIAGRTTVKALALDRTIRPLWEDRHADTIEESLVRGKLADQYANFGAILSLISTILMTGVGAVAIINQELTMGSLIAANMLMGRVLGPFNQLVGSWRNYAQFKQAVTRLGETFATPEDRQSTGVTVDLPKGEVTVEHVTFRYGEEPKPVIDDMRLTIKPGTMVAVMGPNGSGKTTLIKMLQGLYQPTSGRILIDGADIAQFARHDLARWIGYVPQEVFLFAGSIRENIAKGTLGATDQQVIEAAKSSGLHERIIDLSDGYATDIGEVGRKLPGGMRQRLAIARAFIGTPPVVILDEPSSNLDREGEAELVASLRRYAESGKTVIIVTHSGQMLAGCDQVLVLQKGRLVRAGAPEDILPQLAAGATQMRAPKPAAAPLPLPAGGPLPTPAGGPRPQPALALQPSSPPLPAEARTPLPPAPRGLPIPPQAVAADPAPAQPQPQRVFRCRRARRHRFSVRPPQPTRHAVNRWAHRAVNR